MTDYRRRRPSALVAHIPSQHSHFRYFGGPDLPGLTLSLDNGKSVLHYTPRTAEQELLLGPLPNWQELAGLYGWDEVRASQSHPEPLLPAELWSARRQLDAAAQSSLREAVDMSVRAMFAALRAIRPERREFQILATLLVSVTQEGGRPAQAPVVTQQGQWLQYPDYSGSLTQGNLLTVTFGARQKDGFVGLLRRTYPIRTTFTSAQADLYQVVLRAHQAARQSLRPGPSAEVERAARKTLLQGLVDLQILRGDPEELLALGVSSAFFPHPVVLGLALDCPEAGDYSRLEPGFAVCLQMGYLQLPAYQAQAQAHLVPGALEKYAVGSISLADNYWLTEEGHQWLSSALPQELLEIEIVVNS